MKAWRAVDPVGIEQCHGGHAQPGTHPCQILRQRRPFEKAKSRSCMKLDIHQSMQNYSPQRHRDTEKATIRDFLCVSVSLCLCGENTLAQSYVPSKNQPPPNRSCTSR